MKKGTSGSQTIEKLKLTFATMGLLKEIGNDNGPPFNSNEYVSFCSTNGIICSKSPYHPQSNGLSERAVQSVKIGGIG